MGEKVRIKAGDFITVADETELKMHPFLRGKTYQVDQIVGPPRFAKQVGFSAISDLGTAVRMWVRVSRVVKIDTKPIIDDYKRRGLT